MGGPNSPDRSDEKEGTNEDMTMPGDARDPNRESHSGKRDHQDQSEKK